MSLRNGICLAVALGIVGVAGSATTADETPAVVVPGEQVKPEQPNPVVKPEEPASPLKLLTNSLANEQALDGAVVDAVTITQGTARLTGSVKNEDQLEKLRMAALKILQGHVEKGQLAGPVTAVDVSGVKVPKTDPAPPMPVEPPVVTPAPVKPVPEAKAPVTLLARTLQQSLTNVPAYARLNLLAAEKTPGDVVVIYGTIPAEASLPELETEAMKVLANASDISPEVKALGPFNRVDASHLRPALLPAIQEMIPQTPDAQLQVYRFNQETRSGALLGRVSDPATLNRVRQLENTVQLRMDDVIIGTEPSSPRVPREKYSRLMDALGDGSTPQMLEQSAAALKYSGEDTTLMARTWYLRAAAYLWNNDIPRAKAALSIASSLDSTGSDSLHYETLERFQGPQRAKLERLLEAIKSQP